VPPSLIKMIIMKSWHKQDIERYLEVQETIRTQYPGLHLTEEYGLVRIRGFLSVKIPDINREMDHFMIDILFPPDYPKHIPIVRETEGKIPKTADRHFNANGTACLFFRDARHVYFPFDATFSHFMEKIVVSFFVWQIDYEVHAGNPIMKGMAHNTAGILEYYFRFIGTDNVSVVRRFLEYLCAKKIRQTWKCYCDSGKKLRECHYCFIKDLQTKIVSRRDIRTSRAAVLQLSRNMQH